MELATYALDSAVSTAIQNQVGTTWLLRWS